MQRAIFIFMCLSGLVFTSCDNQHNIFFKKGNPYAGLPNTILKDTTTVQFAETEFKFGTIKEGDKVEHIFKLKNTGPKPLIIANAVSYTHLTLPTILRV